MGAVNGMTQRADLDSQLQDLQAMLPAQCVLVGWSLGGQLALELARRAPGQVRALVLMASTPRFTQAADWPQGMDAQTLRAFDTLLAQDWRQTLRDFVQLQVRGGRNAEATQQQLEAALESHGLPRAAALRAGLALLTSLDQRTQLAHIQQPVLVLSGQNDRVTPPAAGQWMADALPNARHIEVARAGHAPLLSHVDEAAAAIREFLAWLIHRTHSGSSHAKWRGPLAQPATATTPRPCCNGMCDPNCCRAPTHCNWRRAWCWTWARAPAMRPCS